MLLCRFPYSCSYLIFCTLFYVKNQIYCIKMDFFMSLMFFLLLLLYFSLPLSLSIFFCGRIRCSELRMSHCLRIWDFSSFFIVSHDPFGFSIYARSQWASFFYFIIETAISQRSYTKNGSKILKYLQSPASIRSFAL